MPNEKADLGKEKSISPRCPQVGWVTLSPRPKIHHMSTWLFYSHSSFTFCPMDLLGKHHHHLSLKTSLFGEMSV